MKFAHIADTHIGAHREPALAKLEAQAFSLALDKCIENKVDFIVLSGDLFQSGIPDLAAVDNAVKKMRKVHEERIPIYAIYGSHDYNPSGKSIIDILDSAGLIKRVVKGEINENKLKLEFTIDPKTGAKLVGISARKAGLESKYYEILDRKSLESEDGFKIFVFHSALDEFKPKHLSQMESIPISYLPKGFDYYAGGHIHKRSENKFSGYEQIVFPGTLFASYPRDFEENAKGAQRGFYIIHFDKKVEKLEFIPIVLCECTYYEYNVSNKNSTQAQGELKKAIQNLNVKGKLVLLKVFGELAGGKTSDLEFSELRRMLLDRGANYVNINRFGLSSKEYANVKVVEEDITSIENRLFKDNINSVKLSNKTLKDDSGVRLAHELLKTVRQEQKIGETKKDYEARVSEGAIKTLQLKEII
ncbi:MAG: exonuclease SbcCD subunit D [Candidatus Bathyarchaeota archaeon]